MSIVEMKIQKIHWFFKVIFGTTALFTVWVIFYFGLPQALPVQKITDGEVYGLIFSDQIWEGQISIVGDIYSLTNSTVRVMPGTKILVAISGDKSNLDWLPWHKKSGVNTGKPIKGVETGEPFWDESEKIQIHFNNLEILGDVNNPAVIRSDTQRGSPYDFNVLSVKNGRIANAIFSNYRRLESQGELVIFNSTFKDTGECSLCLYSGRPKIYSSNFENSLKESIWVSKASPKISNNLFINLVGEGIKIDSKKLSSPQITNNTFEMPQGIAINIISGGNIEEGLITGNIFAGNSQIKIACDSKVKIRDNVILGQVSFSTGCSGSYTFGPNFWGTPDTKIILKDKILNKYDKFAISMPNVLLSPPKEAGRR